jgi:hypothetical protein
MYLYFPDTPRTFEVEVCAPCDLTGCIVVKANRVIVFELVGKSCREMGVPLQPYISGKTRTTPVDVWSRGWELRIAGYVCCIS